MTMPPLAFRRDSGRALRHPLVWLARELSVDALTGQAGTLTRTATAAPTDSYATARTVVHSQPAWQTDTTHGRTGLLLGASETLAWPLPLIPQAMSGLVEFIENGTLGTASDAIWYLGSDAASGAHLYIDSTGTQYRINHYNGTSTVSATMTGTAPTSGQKVRLRWWLYSDGKVDLWQSINDAAETSPAVSGTLALASAWGGTTCRLNSKGTANYGAMIGLGCVVMLGNQTESTLKAALT